MFGPFTVDCFASQYTAKCEKFYSKFWCPGSHGVDAFCFDWSRENCWLVPPLYLVVKVIFHLEFCHSRGTLVVPAWKSAIFWPVLFPLGLPRRSVKHVLEFACDDQDVFDVPTRPIKTLFSKGQFKASVMAISFDAS